MKKVMPASPVDESSSVQTHIHENAEAYGTMDEGKRKAHLQYLGEVESKLKEYMHTYNTIWRGYKPSKQMDIAQV